MPTQYRPSTTYFNGGLLLCVSFGFTLAALNESYLRGDWGWFACFCVAETICIALYTMNVRWWLTWMNHSGDSSPTHANVGSEHEPPYHTDDR